MYFKIDYDKVNDIGKSMKVKSEELDSLYRDVLDICHEIGRNYISEDSTVYLSRFEDYIKDFIYENQYLREGGYTLYRISKLYGSQEEDWAKTVYNSDLNKRGEN